MSVAFRDENALLRGRLTVVFLGFIAAMSLIVLRLAYLQALRAPDFRERALRMQGREQTVLARRGRILDRNGAELAVDVMARSICVNPRTVKDPQATAGRLGELLKLTEGETADLAERIASGKRRNSAYRLLKRGADRRLAEQVIREGKKDPRLRGLWLEETPVRVYPSGANAAQLVGIVNVDGKGIEATEQRFDETLRGADGLRIVRMDALGVPIPATETRFRAPVNGEDVRLTIDRDVQHFVEQQIAAMAAEQNPDAAVAVVLDTATAEVLAMASWPSFQSNDSEVKPEQRKNRAITDAYEPGSIFKIFTAAAALETGETRPVQCGGSRAVGNRTIRCAHGSSHGTVDLRRMVEKSCNVTAGTLAERVGPKKLHAILDQFGFQTRTGIEFPGETTWTLQKPEDWRAVRTTNIGFGQGIMTTPIQIAAAYNAIANGGQYVAPRLVKAVGGHPQSRPPSRRVVSSENSKLLRSYLRAVVDSGTGKAAKIAGYTVAGKTGTAQIAENGRYGGAYLASFAGFVPALQPRLTIVVSVWHPRRGHYGGVVAAPVFREIARKCVLYLGIEPDAPTDLKDGAPAGQRGTGSPAIARADD